MTNAGIKSSQAGTSLRKIMTELNGDLTLTGKSFGEIKKHRISQKALIKR